MTPFSDPAVEAAFDAFPSAVRGRLLELRETIFDTAKGINGLGPLQETLKWGQPAYLTPICKPGTTLRLGVPKRGGYALFVHCQTRVIPEFRAQFPDVFSYDETRAVLLRETAAPDMAALRLLIRSALTYHRR